MGCISLTAPLKLNSRGARGKRVRPHWGLLVTAGLETERISQIRSNRRTKHLYVTRSTLPWAQYEAAIKTPKPKASAWLTLTWDHLENNPHGQTI